MKILKLERHRKKEYKSGNKSNLINSEFRNVII
jgi:hypothetical protein